MEDLILQLENIMSAINVDLARVKNQNKAAAQRVRIQSIELEKKFKEFRKRSVHEVTGIRGNN